MSIGTSPKAKRVKDHILNQLATGLLTRGDLLPSEAEMAESLRVGRYSVRQAMNALSRAGILRRVRKKGTFVSLDSPRHEQSRKELASSAKEEGYAIIVPEVLSGIYPSLIKGFGQGAAKYHQQSFLCETKADIYIQGDTLLRLVENNVAGVAIVPSLEAMPDYQLQALHRRNIPVVFCHRRTTDLAAPLVKWSWEDVGRLAGNTLADLGHTRIAFVDVVKTISTERYEWGLNSALAERGILWSSELAYYGVRTLVSQEMHPNVEDIIERLLDMVGRVTGVFCGDDYISERLYLAAMHRGLKVPGDLSIIGFGPSYRDGQLRSELSAVVVDEIELGNRAVELLDEMRSGWRPMNSNEEIILPVRLHEGKTLGPPPSVC